MYELYLNDLVFFEALCECFKQDREHCLLVLNSYPKLMNSFKEYDSHIPSIDSDIIRLFYKEKSYYNNLREVMKVPNSLLIRKSKISLNN